MYIVTSLSEHEMKEALICIIMALVVGSLFNTMRSLDGWGMAQTPGTPGSSVPLVAESDFSDEVVNASKPVLINFYCDDNAESKAMAPVVADCAKELKGSIKVVRVDASESPQIAQLFSIKALPDLVVFKNGQEIGHHVGVMTVDELVAFAKSTATEMSPTAKTAKGTDIDPNELPITPSSSEQADKETKSPQR
jgi:thioredoxin 1